MTKKKANKKEKEFLDRIDKSIETFENRFNESIKSANEKFDEIDVLIEELKKDLKTQKVKA